MSLKPKEDGRRVSHNFLYLRYIVEIHVPQMCPMHSGFGIPISSLRKMSTQRSSNTNMRTLETTKTDRRRKFDPEFDLEIAMFELKTVKPVQENDLVSNCLRFIAIVMHDENLVKEE